MIWVLAMAACFGFMLMQKSGAGWPINKLRVWLVLFASWLLGMWSVEATGDATPSFHWMAIDFAAAVFVLHLFKPVGFAQKLIGSLYTIMVVWHMVYAAGGETNPPLYTWFQTVVGWFQWGVLMFWSAGDVGKAIAVRLGLHRHIDIDSTDIGANRG